MITDISIDEIREKIKLATIDFLSSGKLGEGVFLISVSIFNDSPKWSVNKLVIKENIKDIEEIDFFNTKAFIKKVLQSQAETTADRLQVGAMMKIIPSNIFVNIDKSISNNLSKEELILIGVKESNLFVTLNEKGRYKRTINLKK